MPKVAIVLLADTSSPGDMGRMANALTTAREFHEAGDETKVIFDGAGTKWVPLLSDPEHKYHALFAPLRQLVSGVCEYCANAYGVAEEVGKSGFSLTSEYNGHPSLRKLVADGYQILTF